jgi:hypothetical protein
MDQAQGFRDENDQDTESGRGEQNGALPGSRLAAIGRLSAQLGDSQEEVGEKQQ